VGDTEIKLRQVPAREELREIGRADDQLTIDDLYDTTSD
jgi:hypothetical protein